MNKSAVMLLLVLVLELRTHPVLPVCGDIFPPGNPGTMDCGDGVVNVLDANEGLRIIENHVIPTNCQLINGDAPNGIPGFCGYAPGVSNCEINGVFDTFDYMVIVDKAMGRINCCDHCFNDADRDGFVNEVDNCPNTPNGPILGTCRGAKKGVTCTSNEECGTVGVCSMNQEDHYPPSGNGVGDVCDCEGNFDCDQDVDGSDASKFRSDFGRNQFYNPCPDCKQCTMTPVLPTTTVP